MAGQGATRRGWNRDDTSVTVANAPTMAPGWSATVSGNADEAIGTSSVVVAHSASQLRGLAPGSGAGVWTAALATGVGSLRDDKVFVGVGGADCTLRSLKSADGSAVGSVHFGGPIFTPAGLSLCSTTESILGDDVRVILPWQTATVGTGGTCGAGVTRWSFTAGISAFTTDLAPLWASSTTQSGCGTVPNFNTLPRYGAVAACDEPLRRERTATRSSRSRRPAPSARRARRRGPGPSPHRGARWIP